VLALILLQVISSALNLLGVSPFLTLALWGVILVAVAGVSVLRQRLGKR
jgi:simple sugar transport system permease protein